MPIPLMHPLDVPENDAAGPDIVTASEQYALRFAGATGAFFLERQSLAVATLLDHAASRPMTVLDVGGGHAQLTQLFLDRGHSVVVHGSATSCFNRIAALESRNRGRLQRLLGALDRIPAEDGAFDVVCSIRLFAHVASWPELIAEKCRLSRRYVICEFAVNQGTQRLASPLHLLKVRMEPDTRPFTTASLESVSAEFERHGFRIVHVERQFVIPMVVHRLLASAGLSRGVESLFAAAGITRRIGSPAIVLAERVTA